MTNFDSYYEPPSYDEYCVVCGKDVDACICPVCEMCGEQGNPDCYIISLEGAHMIKSQEQIDSLAEVKAQMEADRLADDALEASLLEDERLRQENPEYFERQYHANCHHCHSQFNLNELKDAQSDTNYREEDCVSFTCPNCGTLVDHALVTG